MPRLPIVALYARVSTDDQSVEAQLRDLREFCQRRDWAIAQEFIDSGYSGAKDSRPAWNECYDAIQKGRVDVLVVHALDRLGRSLPHLVKILTTLTERQVTLISYRENIDLSTAAGRMMAGFFSVLAEYELSMIRERTRAGLRAARARGKQIGRAKRFFDKRKATELRDAGWGQIKIARELGIGVGRVNEWIKHEYLPREQREKIEAALTQAFQA